jgi:hypothetical protein
MKLPILLLVSVVVVAEAVEMWADREFDPKTVVAIDRAVEVQQIREKRSIGQFKKEDLHCNTGTCRDVSFGQSVRLDNSGDGSLSDSVDALGAPVSNAHLLACCGICATTAKCYYWSLYIELDCHEWRCLMTNEDQVADPGVPALSFWYGPHIISGYLDETKRDADLTYWKDQHYEYVFNDASSGTATTAANLGSTAAAIGSITTFEGCVEECKKEPGCTYFKWHRDDEECFLAANSQLEAVVRDTEWESGALSLVTSEECEWAHNVEFLGNRLHPQSIYPVTHPQCCHICKTSLGCASWTWSIERTIPAPVTGTPFDPTDPPFEGILQGVCVLKASKGFGVENIDPMIISG